MATPILPEACTTALVRDVPETLSACELTWIDREPIGIEAARRSHAAYVAALRESGLRVLRAPADDAHPDCPFVEDVLVAIGDLRVLCRPGADARRGERDGVRRALHGTPLVEMPAPLRMDGGDVLQVAGRVFVGTSTRTSADAVAWLAERVSAPVIPIPMRGPYLHLKTACTAIDERTVLFADADVAEVLGAPLRDAGLDTLVVPPGEEAAANVLRTPRGLLLAAGHAGTLALLRGRGAPVRVVDIEPFARAEAGLTCLSVLFREGTPETP